MRNQKCRTSAMGRALCFVASGGAFPITNASMAQDGGFVRVTNAQMALSRSEYDLTNGVFEGGTVVVGSPISSQFNQYGGAATIATLDLGIPVPGSSGTYA